MVQALLTRKGREKEAAALANGQALVIAHMVFGDGNYAATGGETALRNEVERKAIHAQGVVTGKANVSFFKARLEEADGPYNIREIGLLDKDGDLVAIATLANPLVKPDPDVDVRSINLTMHVAFSDLQNLVLRVVSHSAYVSAGRKMNTGNGLKGGGDLAQDRTLEIDFATALETKAGENKTKAVNPFGLTAALDALWAKFQSAFSVNANVTAQAGQELWVDASAGERVVKLPANPTDGAKLFVGRLGANHLNIDGNGQTIEGQDEVFRIDIDRRGVWATFVGSTWKLKGEVLSK